MGVRLNNLPSAIKQPCPAATKSSSAVEEAAVLDETFDYPLYGLHEKRAAYPVDSTLRVVLA